MAVYQDLTTRTNVAPDMAIMNAGGLRVEFEEGEVTYSDLFNIQPFTGENTSTVLSGTQLKMSLSSSGVRDPPVRWKTLAYPTMSPTPLMAPALKVIASPRS